MKPHLRLLLFVLFAFLSGCNDLTIEYDHGSGSTENTVQLTPAGEPCEEGSINCYTYDSDAEVTLQAVPAEGSGFLRWEGIEGCGEAEICTFVISEDTLVSVYFDSLSEIDSDGDGVADNDDAFPDDTSESSDADGDGIGDNSDPDGDNDGFTNEHELIAGTDPFDPTSIPDDLDGDFIPDVVDTDIDGDGVENSTDAFPYDATEYSDFDGDGIGDNSDTDIDNDGYSNENELAVGTSPTDATSIPDDQDGDFIPDTLDSDIDGDGYDNDTETETGSVADNPYIIPADQDGDFIPDSLDTDRDGDGVENDQDALPDNADEVADLDGDGVGDNADEDIDGDGFDNQTEELVGTDSRDVVSVPADLDGDFIPDSLDEDRDGDGVVNLEDDYPDDPTRFLVEAGIEFTSPISGFVTTEGMVEVIGTYYGPITTIRIDDVEATVSEWGFVAQVPLIEGLNKLTAVGEYESLSGIRAATNSKNVIRDTSPPNIIISSITDGMVTTTPAITISGAVDDLRSNLSEVVDPVVTVNGIVVPVSVNTFELPDYNLRPGSNVLLIQATDAMGNSRQVSRTVIYMKDAGQKILELSGNNQTGEVQTELSEPFAVRLVDRNNIPLTDRPLNFQVTEGDGTLKSGSREGRRLAVITNEYGSASVDFLLGSRSGTGKHQVTVSSTGFPGEVVFSASAYANDPAFIVASRGSQQFGMMGSLLPEPLIARVTDGSKNPVPGVDVVFRVKEGGGRLRVRDFEPAEEVMVTTDRDGNAIVDLELGKALADLGDSSQVVEAQVYARDGLTAEFVAHNLRPGALDETSITGLILDNSNLPMKGVEVKISGNSFNTRETLTNDKGRFVFEQAPVGTVHLYLDGSTSDRPGEWPHLMFEMVTVSGQENTVGMPIYFPKVDYDGGKIAGGDQEVIIPMAGVAGASVIIAPNSMTFPDGRTSGRMMFTQVQSDKMPMPAPNGTTFDYSWTLQPAGVAFDPPARVTLPNTGGAHPGEEVEIFSFDHDLMEWVSAGPGVVSEDASIIISREGYGIRHSGWGGNPPRDPDDTCNTSCKSSNECYNKYKVAKCRCRSEKLEGKVLSKQQPDDCKVLKCFGDYDPVDEPVDDRTGEGDCKVTKCVDGGPSNEPDPSDLPDPEKDDSNKCKTCEDGNVVEDKSKNDIKCSDKENQECFVCVDGRCKRPDCDAPAPKVDNTFKYTAFGDAIKKVKAISTTNPYINLSLDPINLYGNREAGEKCCDCADGGEPKSYEKFSAGVSSSAGITVTAPGLGVAVSVPDQYLAWGFRVSGKIEAGALGRGSMNFGGSINHEVSKCKDEEPCTKGLVKASGRAEVGVSVLLEVTIKDCLDNDDKKCTALFGIGGETTVAATAAVDFSAAVYEGDSCSSGGCAGGAVRKLGGVARVFAKIMQAGIFETSFGFEEYIVVWDEFTYGEPCG